MKIIKDDWKKPRSNGTALTDAEIRSVRVAFDQGRLSRDIARELKCSTRAVTRYYAIFRGTPQKLGRPKYRDLMHAPKSAPSPTAAQSRFYKSNFEI
ncbi:MAG TPA: hypothetical protein VIM11_26850 [Tepidisphaeraceae bacterium]